MTVASPTLERPRSSFIRLVVHQFHADLRCFFRNKESVFWTLALPILFLVIFGSVFQHQNVAVAGGRIDEPVYYVPGIIAYGVIAATFSNLGVSVVRYREAGIYKRRRATPVSASALIVARALVAALSALAITAFLLAVGWAAFGAHIPSRTVPVVCPRHRRGRRGLLLPRLCCSVGRQERGRGPTGHAGDHFAALLHIRCVHPDPGTAALADRCRQVLPRACAGGLPPCGVQPAHHRERAELGRPGGACRLGCGGARHCRSSLQLAPSRHLKHRPDQGNLGVAAGDRVASRFGTPQPLPHPSCRLPTPIAQGPKCPPMVKLGLLGPSICITSSTCQARPTPRLTTIGSIDRHRGPLRRRRAHIASARRHNAAVGVTNANGAGRLESGAPEALR